MKSHWYFETRYSPLLFLTLTNLRLHCYTVLSHKLYHHLLRLLWHMWYKKGRIPYENNTIPRNTYDSEVRCPIEFLFNELIPFVNSIIFPWTTEMNLQSRLAHWSNTSMKLLKLISKRNMLLIKLNYRFYYINYSSLCTCENNLSS